MDVPHVVPMLHEAIDWPVDLGDPDACSSARGPIVATDSKSTHGHVKANAPPASLKDKRSAIDV
eukprot:1350794-Pyramimonas_sp.AAC.1